MPKATQLLSSRARIQTQMLNLYTEHCHEEDDLDCGGSCGHGEQKRLFSSQAVRTVYALGCEEVERNNKDCFSENVQSWQRQEPGGMKCEVSQDHSQHASGGTAALLQLIGFVYDSK